ncbi:MAG: DUF4381 domain-containing protein [Sphingobacteriia bacterium]|nr:DUF4381 domain-containing protein [Sphingobacteriia bacterium]NCC39773.1 DUF4381 domain-containing protein [Gammaproteobacteria bacterium]
MAALRDIHDIPPLPWWPPALGWWLLALGLLLILVAAWRWRGRLARLSLRIPVPGITLGTWRWDGAAGLRDLRARVRRGHEVKPLIGELSELLRRIAMARLGRSACAGLTGAAWLDWLTEHDPQGFAWRERGRLLIDGPYAPVQRLASANQTDDLLVLIDAALGWVEAVDTAGRWSPPWRWPWGPKRV